MEELKKALEEQGSLIKQIRDESEKKELASQEKLEAMKTDFLKLEETNQKLILEQEAQKKNLDEKLKLFEEAEKKFARFPTGTDDSEKKEAIKSFERYAKEFPIEGKQFAFSTEDAKYLRTDLAADGGVLVPDILSNELLKQEIEISPILANARLINSKVKSINIPIRTTIGSVNRPGEGGTSTVSNSKYKTARLEAYRNDIVTPITREELNFTMFNMENQMTIDAALALTYQTNYDFLLGNGVSKSEGIMTNASVTTVNSGIAADIDLDNFLTMQKKDNIKSAYRSNGKFYMNSNTLFDLLARKDGMGAYLWNQNIALGLPNTIAGRPYIDTPDMDDIDTNLYPVLFGDLSKAYYILRAVNVELVIDPYTSKKEGIIEYMWIEFIGGKVVLPEAINKLKCHI